MAEWSNAPVLKTGNGLSRSRVQIPIPPPHSNKKALSKDKAFLFGRKIGLRTPVFLFIKESYPSSRFKAKCQTDKDKAFLVGRKIGL
tara:strand:+ start:9622 stop:9882 length:261 start_codon:yes stop_codon:yes gene_type:complete